MEIPHYSTLSRRANGLKVPIQYAKRNNQSRPLHLVIDSTGLKVFGEGEWKMRVHGKQKRRVWRKLHLGVDEASNEILTHELTMSNIHDGILLADKGYISKEWFRKLWRKGLHIMVGIRKNMKNYLLPLYNKLLMRKRFIVETVFGVLKQDMGLEHSRHRSPINAIVHVLSCLIAYCMKKKKPKMTFLKKICWKLIHNWDYVI